MYNNLVASDGEQLMAYIAVGYAGVSCAHCQQKRRR